MFRLKNDTVVYNTFKIHYHVSFSCSQQSFPNGFESIFFMKIARTLQSELEPSLQIRNMQKIGPKKCRLHGQFTVEAAGEKCRFIVSTAKSSDS